MARIIPIILLVLSCELSREADLPASQILAALRSADQDLPANLTGTKLFKEGDPLRPQFGVIPYDVKASLWTDGAKKRRYIFIPPDQEIDYDTDTAAMRFPIGTVFAKHFATPSGESLETRVIILKDDLQWYFGTYVGSKGDTELVTNPRTVTGKDGLDYRIPSEKECRMCHNSVGEEDPILGFSIPQLNYQGSHGENQLERAHRQALFSAELGILKAGESIPDPTDPQLPLATRARAYVAVNCSPCHQPGGVAEEGADGIKIDLRWASTDTRLVAEGKVIPGDPDNSVLWQKFSADVDRMPPLSLRQDPIADKLLKAWIEQWPGE